MKKICVVLFMVAMLSLFFCGCSNGSDSVTCYVPDGAPALAVANIASGKNIGDTSVETIVTTGEDVVAKCASGEADLAVLPTNAAVTICSKRSDYVMYSVNVHGLLYVVGTKHIADVSQLQGEILSIGLGNTPEFVFKTVLDAATVQYASDGAVQIKYYQDGSTIIPLLMQAAQKGETKFAVLGEPAVSNLLAKAEQQSKEMYRLFDLQQLWQQATNSQTAGYPQASLIVKRNLLQNKTFADSLKTLVFSNGEFLQNNVGELNALMQSIGSSLDVNYTSEIIKNCNLNPVFAKDVKADIETYLNKFAAVQQYLPLSQDIFYE
ncbi:MAG: hypothetical protein NC132_03735 [Corallococcus sp.]|nr:hypothetical protein [Corallococcus sp.]MCM1359611.1 hypothetical protein [Corallococcus sp.]MCM1395203.1 hypothetical protein [Corallococcus sp.]